jgi:uncharacterized protein YndB with AHSA1/START domain
MSSAAVTVVARIAVDPDRAFAAFTGEIGSWWGAGTRLGWNGTLRFEPGAGGRLVKHRGAEVVELGRVRVWEPGKCLVFELREEGGGATEVEVRFEALGSGTRVTIEHRGFEALPADHPVRCGLAGEGLARLWGRCWSERLDLVRARAERRL